MWHLRMRLHSRSVRTSPLQRFRGGAGGGEDAHKELGE